MVSTHRNVLSALLSWELDQKASALVAGIIFMPVDIWIKGYLSMGTLFTIGSTFSLAITMRDQHEAQKLIHKISNAKTEKMLKDFEITSN